MKGYRDNGVGELFCFNGHTGGVNTVAFSPDTRFAISGSMDGTIRLWDIDFCKEVSRFQIDNNPGIWSVAFLPDGTHFLTGSTDAIVRLWDIETEQEVCRFEGHSASIDTLSVSADGRRFASAGEDRTVRVWDIFEKREIACFKKHFKKIRTICLAPHGKYVCSAGKDLAVLTWEVDSGEEIYNLRCSIGSIESAAFSKDTSYVVTGSYDGGVYLWDESMTPPPIRLAGHTSSVDCVAFSPDGHYVIAGCLDGTIRYWSKWDENAICCFKGHQQAVKSVTFSPDGNYALSGSWDGSVRLWRLTESAEDAESQESSTLGQQFLLDFSDKPTGNNFDEDSDEGDSDEDEDEVEDEDENESNDFKLYDEDYALIETAKQLAWAIVKFSRVTPAQLIGFGKFLKAIENLPEPSEDINLNLTVSIKDGDEEYEEMRYWNINISNSVFDINGGGSVYDRRVGSDTFTTFSFTSEIGGRCVDGDLYDWLNQVSEYVIPMIKDKGSKGLEVRIHDEDE